MLIGIPLGIVIAHRPAVQQAGAGERQHYSDDSQSCALRVSAARAVAGRTRGPAGDSGLDALCPAAHDPEHLYGNPRGRSRCGGSGTRHGTYRTAAFVSSGIAAGDERDSFGRAGGGCHLGGAGHDRRGDWRWRARRVHLPGLGHGRQPESFWPAQFRPQFWRWWRTSAWDGWRGVCGHDEESSLESSCIALATLSVTAVLLSSCSPSHSDRIVIGSKNFTESFILGELMAQQIEAHTNLKVERRFYLAGTYICHQAVLAGRIDIYPEYTGTALTAILKQKVCGDKAGGLSAGEE